MERNHSMKQFEGATLLITGGTGSFGHVAARRFLDATGIAEIRVFSRDEKKQDDMRREFSDPRLRFFIGDVRDRASVDSAMRGVDYVFHAAALKQVPSCEFFPMEAVKTNVIGTDNVLESAIANGVKKVVCLSTDKAAYPINAMGTSKAMMEKVFIAKSRSSGSTVICGTRYGNVMASRGSVIPLFAEQARSNSRITVTEPNMTRFLMSLDEALDLVVYAFLNAESGDLMIMKSPSSTIMDLAKAVREIFGSSSEIVTIGSRHGEKLYETLMTREEAAKAVDMGRFFRVPADNRDLNYGKYFTEGSSAIGQASEYTSENTRVLTVEEVKEKLMALDYVKEQLR